jgi:uncharacterized membrane protein YjgN (DUF898 family)
MDTKTLAAPGAPDAPMRATLRFEGTTSEYFKIWIVNVALTVMTLGIFSAWAKVRSKRYLYGNTFIGDHAFDYHAPPLRILLGRAIALALLVGYSVSAIMAPLSVALWYILLVAAFPWMVKSSLRFAARNTSYRNIRFDFHGTYWDAFKAFILWPILVVVTILIALPYSRRARDYYNINNHSFGPFTFRADIPIRELYERYLQSLFALVAGAIVLAVLAMAIFDLIPSPSTTATVIVTYIALGVGISAFPAFVGALTFNVALNNTQMRKDHSPVRQPGEDFHFESRLSALWMSWLAVSNLAAIIFTLGLAYPWARIRRTRYMASCISVIGNTDIGNVSSAPVAAGSAVGEEMASFLDIDFGL